MGYSPWGGKELDTTAVSEHACTHALYSPNDRIQCLHFCLSLICSFCNICTHILKTISPIGTGVRYCLHVVYVFSLVSWSPLLILLSFCAVRCCAVLSHFSRVRLFVTLRTVAQQDPPSMGFSGKEYWSGLPCSSATGLPDLGIEPLSLMSPALAGGFFTTRATWEALLFSPV